MGRERATRISMRGFCARAAAIRRMFVAAPLLLSACETLPGSGSTGTSQDSASRPAFAVPMPPPPRPRGPSTVGQRFRGGQSAAQPESAEFPAPPPDAPTPTIRAEMPAVTPPPAPGPANALAGDSAAAEVARAEPAATPPIQAPPPLPPPSIDPASLIGVTDTALRDRLGAPDGEAPIASGTTWRYQRPACTASFVLLPQLSSGALRVFSYEIAPREGAMFGPAGCLGRIAATRDARAAGTAP
jgi:hypothetical protein